MRYVHSLPLTQKHLKPRTNPVLDGRTFAITCFNVVGWVAATSWRYRGASQQPHLCGEFSWWVGLSELSMFLFFGLELGERQQNSTQSKANRPDLTFWFSHFGPFVVEGSSGHPPLPGRHWGAPGRLHPGIRHGLVRHSALGGIEMDRAMCP